MFNVAKLSDPYEADDGETLVIYFLANAQSWHGPTANAVKAELRRRLREASCPDCGDAAEREMLEGQATVYCFRCAERARRG